MIFSQINKEIKPRFRGGDPAVLQDKTAKIRPNSRVLELNDEERQENKVRKKNSLFCE